VAALFAKAVDDIETRSKDVDPERLATAFPAVMRTD
jgi:hypothetical protein